MTGLGRAVDHILEQDDDFPIDMGSPFKHPPPSGVVMSALVHDLVNIIEYNGPAAVAAAMGYSSIEAFMESHGEAGRDQAVGRITDVVVGVVGDNITRDAWWSRLCGAYGNIMEEETNLSVDTHDPPGPAQMNDLYVFLWDQGLGSVVSVLGYLGILDFMRDPFNVDVFIAFRDYVIKVIVDGDREGWLPCLRETFPDWFSD